MRVKKSNATRFFPIPKMTRLDNSSEAITRYFSGVIGTTFGDFRMLTI